MSDTGKYAVTGEDIQRAEHEVSLIVLRMRARKDEQAIDKKALDEAADRLAELKADARAGQMRIDVGTGEVFDPETSPTGNPAADADADAEEAMIEEALKDMAAEGLVEAVDDAPPDLPAFRARVRDAAKARDELPSIAVAKAERWLRRPAMNLAAAFNSTPSAAVMEWLAAYAAGNVGEDGRIRAEAAGVGAT